MHTLHLSPAFTCSQQGHFHFPLGRSSEESFFFSSVLPEDLKTNPLKEEEGVEEDEGGLKLNPADSVDEKEEVVGVKLKPLVLVDSESDEPKVEGTNLKPSGEDDPEEEEVEEEEVEET